MIGRNGGNNNSNSSSSSSSKKKKYHTPHQSGPEVGQLVEPPAEREDLVPGPVAPPHQCSVVLARPDVLDGPAREVRSTVAAAAPRVLDLDVLDCKDVIRVEAGLAVHDLLVLRGSAPHEVRLLVAGVGIYGGKNPLLLGDVLPTT
jgi:hypothetical protein